MTEYINQEGESFNSLEELIENELNCPSIVPTPSNQVEEENDYANWVIDGKDFYPAANTKITSKLPNGVYKIIETRDDFKVVPYNIDTDDLYVFSEDFTSKILEDVQSFWDKKDVYKKYNLTHKRGILLCGNPGSGKTSIINLLIKRFVEKDGLVFMVSSIMDFNVLASTIKPIIRKIEPERPIITIIEDINQIIDECGGNDHLFLDFMDGKNSIDNHLVILTSNDTSNLSDALLRPSRIDLTYEILNPDEKIRKEYFAKKGVEEKDLDKFAKLTEGMSFAQMKEVFIGTVVQGTDIKKVVKRILDPFKCKDYLNKTKPMKGIE